MGELPPMRHARHPARIVETLRSQCMPVRRICFGIAQPELPSQQSRMQEFDVVTHPAATLEPFQRFDPARVEQPVMQLVRGFDLGGSSLSQ
jgi:hypothetical protein